MAEGEGTRGPRFRGRFEYVQVRVAGTGAPDPDQTWPGPGSGTGTSRSSGGFCAATNWNACMMSSSLLVTDPVAVDQQVFRAAENIAPPVRRRVDDEPRVFDAAKELESEVHLQARQWAAEAGVDAAAPSEVFVIPAFRVECIRIGELYRIAVRGTVHQVDRRTLWDDESH